MKRVYKVQWLESRVILTDVYTFIQAESKEEAVKIVKAKQESKKTDVKKSRFQAKYSHKSKV